MVITDFHLGMRFKFRTKGGREGIASVLNIDSAFNQIHTKWYDRNGVHYELFQPEEFMRVQQLKEL